MNTTTLTFVIFILFVHYIGDYIAQTRKQADNKHHDLLQLFYHTGTYSLVIFGMLLIGNHFNFAGQLNTVDIGIYTLVNFGLHFVADFFTSKQIKKLWSGGLIYAAFAVMGLDQFIHVFSLLATSTILFN